MLSEPPRAQYRSSRVYLCRLLLSAAPALLIVWGVLWWPYTVDDSYITYRYAENLAAGDGAVYNKGERVEGYSSPGWMLLLSLAIMAGLDPMVVSKVLGLVAAAALLALLYRALKRAGCDPWISGLACVVLASLPSMHIYSISGMETIPFAFAVAAVALPLADGAHMGRLMGPMMMTALVAVATLRPEGVLVVIMVTAGCLATRSSNGWGRWIAGAWLALGAMLVTRGAYYGAMLPNTFVAKPSPIVRLLAAGHLKTALRKMVESIGSNVVPALAEFGGIVCLLLALVGLMRGERRTALAAAVAGGGFLFVFYARTDWMLGHRFAIPYAAPYLFLAALGADHLRRRLGGRTGRTVVVGLALGAVFWCFLAGRESAGYLARFPVGKVNPALDARNYLPIGEWLRANSRPGDRVLAYEIGAVGYSSGLHIIDHEGLITPAVARMIQSADGDLAAIRHGRDADTMRMIAEYCAGLKPEWYMLRAYTSLTPAVGEPIPPEVALFRLDQTIVEALGDSMILSKLFPMRPRYSDGRQDYYMILSRRERVVEGARDLRVGGPPRLPVRKFR